ncbi:MAG: 23S rRNA (guanosine(2251)-2'-O)-methyltransferase RlmB [Oscillospiraceae bacterium]|jgi:23S rRNA (guanosine2251-2'-O)-methyltransferase|nr:23S rRNA (guanosine(2251)-2'-O)-methyltransferase RlmB [Oscillospiraceae bacterium]
MNMSENIIYGRNSVTELLQSDNEVDTIYLNEKNAETFGKIKSLAKGKGVPVKIVKPEKLKELAGDNNTQGVVALSALVKYAEIEELADKQFLIICDGIEDPHNLGAIIRSAEAAGADGVIIPKRNSVGVNATVFKTSSGAAAHIKIARVANLSNTLSELKKANFWLYGADMNGKPYQQTDFSGKVALVIGSEGYGISENLKKNCDFLVSIPMHGKVNSLNASVAAAVLMFNIVSEK